MTRIREWREGGIACELSLCGIGAFFTTTRRTDGGQHEGEYSFIHCELSMRGIRAFFKTARWTDGDHQRGAAQGGKSQVESAWNWCFFMAIMPALILQVSKSSIRSDSDRAC